MKKNLLLSLTTLFVVALTFSSCAKYPQAEVDKAAQAIDSVKNLGADLYVPEAFASLQDSLKSVMENIEAQKSKLFKNYKTSIASLASIETLAADVAVQSAAKKEELKSSIQTTLTELATLVEENNKLITKAPKGKEGKTALVAMKEEMSAIEASIAEVNTLVEKDDIIAANDKVQGAKAQATALNTELNDIIAKYKGAKR
jgi:hypothetical protein